MKEDVMVSVIMLTYNHEKYIEQAINGVLMQKRNFNFELIIANDQSSDQTDRIVQSILAGHRQRDCINYIHRKENVGMAANFIATFKQCKGKYIALCEGDDYWTASDKLQKQVDFLEMNKDYAMVCHDATVIDEVKGISYPYFTSEHHKQICTTKDLFGILFCPTASILFRKDALQSFGFPDIKVLAGDLLLKLLISLSGLIYRMKENMCVYRITATGATQYNNNHSEDLIRSRIALFNYFDNLSKKKFTKYIRIETLLMKSYLDYLNSKSFQKKIIIKMYRKTLFIRRKKIFGI